MSSLGPRRYTVACTGCTFRGYRTGDTIELALLRPCPRCGAACEEKPPA